MTRRGLRGVVGLEICAQNSGPGARRHGRKMRGLGLRICRDGWVAEIVQRAAKWRRRRWVEDILVPGSGQSILGSSCFAAVVSWGRYGGHSPDANRRTGQNRACHCRRGRPPGRRGPGRPPGSGKKKAAKVGRKRKGMSAAQREAASERMQAYWAARKKGAKKGKGPRAA